MACRQEGRAARALPSRKRVAGPWDQPSSASAEVAPRRSQLKTNGAQDGLRRPPTPIIRHAVQLDRNCAPTIERS